MNWFFVAALAVTGFSMTSCEDEPDKFELADGHPTLLYVRSPLPAEADSLLVGAYMGNTVCLVGNNLRSIYELYFNDQKAVLNTSYMTDHTVLVDVPKTIPTDVTNKIYMVTKSKDTVDFDFKVLVPAPQITSMECEYVQPGSEATIYGDYMIDDPNVPLTITMAGNVPVTEITSVSKTQVSFIVPEGALPGTITMTSIYGTGRSSFQYGDTRNILFDWDGSHGGLALANGWRKGNVHDNDPVENLDGPYLYFGKAKFDANSTTWKEDEYCFNHWAYSDSDALYNRPEFAAMIEKYGVANLQIKFEINVPSENPWKANALQVMFTKVGVVDGNGYYSDGSPRGLWTPWKNTGSYDTGGKWQTVSMKLSEFIYTHEGKTSTGTLSKEDLAGLTFFVWNGGVAGAECEPVICIDNIRVVPVE